VLLVADREVPLFEEKFATVLNPAALEELIWLHRFFLRAPQRRDL